MMELLYEMLMMKNLKALKELSKNAKCNEITIKGKDNLKSVELIIKESNGAGILLAMANAAESLCHEFGINKKEFAMLFSTILMASEDFDKSEAEKEEVEDKE